MSQKQNIQPDYQAVNRALKSILDHYKTPTVKLIQHLQKEGKSLDQIGDIVGLSKQALQQNYLKKVGESK